MAEILTELQNYFNRIEDLRGQIRDLTAGLPAEALNWRPTEAVEDHATNSLAVMATHVAGSMHYWIAEVIGRRPATRDRAAEFRVEVSDPAELIALLDRVGTEVREIFASLQPADLDGTRQAQDETVPVRWAMLHVVDHTALHLGHMQITYQLWREGRGVQSPRWFQRLPKEE